MKKIFIYYSLTGNGDFVADYLKGKEYDVEKIISREKMPNSFVLRILIGGYKATIGYKDKIENIDLDINTYDEIIIGSPIWNGRLSSPINRLLENFDFSNKKITFVFYSGSGKIDKALKQIAKKISKYEIINLIEPKKNNEELKKLLMRSSI